LEKSRKKGQATKRPKLAHNSSGKHVFRRDGQARARAQVALEITSALSIACGTLCTAGFSLSPKPRLLSECNPQFGEMRRTCHPYVPRLYEHLTIQQGPFICFAGEMEISITMSYGVCNPGELVEQQRQCHRMPYALRIYLGTQPEKERQVHTHSAGAQMQVFIIVPRSRRVGPKSQCDERG
jgi:hypothetical protein